MGNVISACQSDVQFVASLQCCDRDDARQTVHAPVVVQPAKAAAAAGDSHSPEAVTPKGTKALPGSEPHTPLISAHQDSVANHSQPDAQLRSQGGERTLSIVHFNDVYNIEPREKEPVGGAARFVTKTLELQKKHEAMVLFSGDCLNPSLLSTVTSGWQMAPVLNSLNIHTACLGNHDFDFGVDNLTKFIESTNFPWLMANVLDKNTHQPLAGSHATRLCDWNGVKVGLIGLVEREWLETLACIEVDEVTYLDFVEEGRRLAKHLASQGAEVVIALTHMREPNDHKLANEVPEIHLVLGGHDHHYEAGPIGPHGTWVLKSGTDFRDLSMLTMTIPAQGLSSTRRPAITNHHVEITSDIAEEPETSETVREYMAKLGSAMDEVVGETAVALDGRFKIVRTQESNLGNFVCDCWRLASNADVVILNSGTLRSDTIHDKGPLLMRDLVQILPMLDETVVLEAKGDIIVKALENAVSKYPALEGRFPQVSGVRFEFDPSKPSGARIDPASVYVQGKQVDLQRVYRLATKAYLAQGKDGFDCFLGLKELVRADEGTLLPTTIREHFNHLASLVHPEYLHKVKEGSIPEGVNKGTKSLLEVYFKESEGNLELMDIESDDGGDVASLSAGGRRGCSSMQYDGSVISFDHERGLFTISPEVTSRIVCLRPMDK